MLASQLITMSLDQSQKQKLPATWFAFTCEQLLSQQILSIYYKPVTRKLSYTYSRIQMLNKHKRYVYKQCITQGKRQFHCIYIQILAKFVVSECQLVFLVLCSHPNFYHTREVTNEAISCMGI